MSLSCSQPQNNQASPTEVGVMCCTAGGDAGILISKRVLSTVGHVQKAVLIFFFLVELPHSQTETRMKIVF